MSEEDDLSGLHADLAASSISGCASWSSTHALACLLAMLTFFKGLLDQVSARCRVDAWLTPHHGNRKCAAETTVL